MTTLKRNDVASELAPDIMKPQNQVQDLFLKFEEIKGLISLISREHIDELYRSIPHQCTVNDWYMFLLMIFPIYVIIKQISLY